MTGVQTCALPIFCAPVDTTGAGDTFSGVLSACLAEGDDVLKAVTVAQAASAIEVGRRYVMPAIPTRDEINAFLKKHPDR